MPPASMLTGETLTLCIDPSACATPEGAASVIRALLGGVGRNVQTLEERAAGAVASAKASQASIRKMYAESLEGALGVFVNPSAAFMLSVSWSPNAATNNLPPMVHLAHTAKAAGLTTYPALERAYRAALTMTDAGKPGAPYRGALEVFGDALGLGKAPVVPAATPSTPGALGTPSTQPAPTVPGGAVAPSGQVQSDDPNAGAVAPIGVGALVSA